MRIELIDPFVDGDALFGKVNTKKGYRKTQRPASVTLPHLAALTPPDIDVILTDEMVEEVKFDKNPDLVGISVHTYFAPRAYEIADKFREKGVAVVLGGFHTSVLPEEALQHADSIVIDEAEAVWSQLISDFQKGKLKEIYRGSRLPLNNWPIARRDLLKRKAYPVSDTIIVSRGCPFACDFCVTPLAYGLRYRTRPIDEVIKEIETFKEKLIFFWDNNIIGDTNYAKELFKRLIPFKKIWVGQATITIVNDTELLSLAEKSGCAGLIIGIESFSQKSLEETSKLQNKVKYYKEAIKKIHDHGIGAGTGILYGFDNDDKNIFEKTLEAVKQINIDHIVPSFLTPYPGTRLFKKLEDEGRIITRDWAKYDSNHLVFKPSLLTEEELYSGWAWTMKEFYSFRATTQRIFKLRKHWAAAAIFYLISYFIENRFHKKDYEHIKNSIIREFDSTPA